MRKAEGNLEVTMKSGALQVWRERNVDEVQEVQEEEEDGDGDGDGDGEED